MDFIVTKIFVVVIAIVILTYLYFKYTRAGTVNYYETKFSYLYKKHKILLFSFAIFVLLTLFIYKTEQEYVKEKKAIRQLKLLISTIRYFDTHTQKNESQEKEITYNDIIDYEKQLNELDLSKVLIDADIREQLNKVINVNGTDRILKDIKGVPLKDLKRIQYNTTNNSLRNMLERKEYELAEEKIFDIINNKFAAFKNASSLGFKYGLGIKQGPIMAILAALGDKN